jgi:dTDP-4-amino-4,6-dideoxygalactose transaminase
MAPPPGALPVAAGAASGVLSLPMHPYLQDAEQRQVAEALRQALEA